MRSRPKKMIILNFVILTIVSICAKAQAEMCDVGVDGCSWTCKKTPALPGKVTCLAIPATPVSCEIGSSSSLCGTTCKCSQLNKCTVGVNGCKWTCVTASAPPGTAQCLAYPATPSECHPGEQSTICGTTCTCSTCRATS